MVLDVVIVGGGLSGLTAASVLHKQNRSFLVLEARNRCGGRSYSVDVGEHRCDLGGQWIGAQHHRIRSLLKELGLSLIPQYHEGKHIFQQANGERRIYQGVFSDLNSEIGSFDKHVQDLDQMANQISPENPHLCPNAKLWDSVTLETWQKTNIKSQDMIDLMNVFVKTVYAFEPSQLSLFFFLYYLRTGGGYEHLADITNGAQQDKILGGAQQVSERLADRFRSQVLLESPVRKIRQNADNTVTLQSDKGTFVARKVIIALSPSLVSNIEFQPSLSPTRVALNQRMAVGSVIKVLVFYKTAFWREEGMSGEVLSLKGPLILTYDATIGGDPALVGFVCANEAIREGENKNFENEVLLQLVELFGQKAASPAKFLSKDWSQEQWSRGCYTGAFGPGNLSVVARGLREPIGNIHWAGTETATEHLGYLEGAVQAGERAAQELLGSLPGGLRANL